MLPLKQPKANPYLTEYNPEQCIIMVGRRSLGPPASLWVVDLGTDLNVMGSRLKGAGPPLPVLHARREQRAAVGQLLAQVGGVGLALQVCRIPVHPPSDPSKGLSNVAGLESSSKRSCPLSLSGGQLWQSSGTKLRCCACISMPP